MTGQYLKEYLRRGNYERVVIESSPLLRTLETAAAIAHELGVTEITVRYNWFEWLKDEFFPEGCPVEEMTFVKTQS